MVGIILASHGEFANGILQSGKMIFGEQSNVVACTLMQNEGPKDIYKKMEDAIASLDDHEQILFLVDLYGGTPFNQACTLLKGHEDSMMIITGLNLAMLLEAYGSRAQMDKAHSLGAHIMEAAKEGVKSLPEMRNASKKAASANKDHPQGELAPGSVLGDGHIKYVLARIDTRLLHGQVATAWTKSVNPTRIIVVSDAVSKDDLRKQMIEQAAPPGVKANVIPVDKMIQIAKDTRFGATRAMLLFETPQDALRAIQGGVALKTLNLGSMAHSNGKVALTKTVSMNAADVKTFDELKALGISIDVRKVPNDAADSFDAIFKKAKAEIK